MISSTHTYPTPVTLYLTAAEESCGQGVEQACHAATMRLAEAIIFYLGAVAVARYTQAVVTAEIEPDPTLNRSLRQLRRVLYGQWLGWTARGLAAVPDGPLNDLAGWYATEQDGPVAEAYNGLHTAMVERLAYTGEYKAREGASPRHLFEMVDQYRIRRAKSNAQDLAETVDLAVAESLLGGLRVVLHSTDFFTGFALYAPEQRHLLAGREPVIYTPPAPVPTGTGASLLLLAPQSMERAPLFPLDPLLTYLYCPQCEAFRVGALTEVASGTPAYTGLDPDCEHVLRIGG